MAPVRTGDTADAARVAITMTPRNKARVLLKYANGVKNPEPINQARSRRWSPVLPRRINVLCRH